MRALPTSGKAAKPLSAPPGAPSVVAKRGIADTVAPVIKAYLTRAKAAEVSAR